MRNLCFQTSLDLGDSYDGSLRRYGLSCTRGLPCFFSPNSTAVDSRLSGVVVLLRPLPTLFQGIDGVSSRFPPIQLDTTDEAVSGVHIFDWNLVVLDSIN